MRNSVAVAADRTQSPRIAVIGDIMIDVDLHCACTRICQEGPWPVYSIVRTERRLGGAGNVARMLGALGTRPLLLGLVGCDDWGSARPGIRDACRPVEGRTTTKTRVWINRQLTGPRIDQDLATHTSDDDCRYFIASIRQFAPHAVIVADHGKGVITAELMKQLGELDLPVYIDPVRSTPIPFPAAVVAGGLNELGPGAWQADCVIEKRGADGLRWTAANARGEIPSACRQLVDPLGAGDQLIAALVEARCRGLDLPDAIRRANHAAGLQCERPGCQPVRTEELKGFSRATPGP